MELLLPWVAALAPFRQLLCFLYGCSRPPYCLSQTQCHQHPSLRQRRESIINRNYCINAEAIRSHEAPARTMTI
ncbi:hypothetical protein QBC35DRAFT_509069 [Podospora australis]|uniref:Secreted protein n=1 Tax=Podospora australis TaxID=1536484 RepID=A0AAN7AEF2_9PEZI|nr:hypothetical protein QBC35DRAFT_509069 [Podospora australis]